MVRRNVTRSFVLPRTGFAENENRAAALNCNGIEPDIWLASTGAYLRACRRIANKKKCGLFRKLAASVHIPKSGRILAGWRRTREPAIDVAGLG